MVRRLLLLAFLSACGGAVATPSGPSCGDANGAIVVPSGAVAVNAFEHLIVDGDAAYFDAESMPLLHGSLQSGAVDPIVTDYGAFDARDGSLAWVNRTWVGAGAAGHSEMRSLTITDAQGVTTLAIPPGTGSINRMHVDWNGDVFYEVDDASTQIVFRWDAATRTTHEVSRIAALDWVDHGQIFWTRFGSSDDGVFTLDASGAALRMLADADHPGAYVVGIDADNLYVLTWGPSIVPGGQTFRFRIDGLPRHGGAPFLAFQSATYHRLDWSGLAIDASGLYWVDTATDAANGTIYHAALDGRSEEVAMHDLPTRPLGPVVLALADCGIHVGYVDDTNRKIVSFAK